jgi:hypothetical protein
MFILFRKFGVFSVFVLIAVILAFSMAALWPKPAAVTLAGLSLLATFGALTALGITAGAEFTGQLRLLIVLVSAAYSMAFVGLAWKYRIIAPRFALASLINVGLLLLTVIPALLMTRTR